MTRRDLIQKVILGTTTLVIFPGAFTSCSKDDSNPGGNDGPGSQKVIIDLSLAANAALNTAGGTLVTKGLIIANKGNDSFIALDSECTHQGCIVGYNLAANNFPCPCHGSVFSATGSVINGPAVLPLKSYIVTKSANTLTINL